MDDKVELRVIEVANSQEHAGAYALLLGEVNGERKLPIIIGTAEAQATAVYLKHAKTPRPLTHDLFATTLSALGVKLLRMLIYRANEGVFYSYIYIKNGEEIIRIDCRTSDAVALAVRLKAPIFIYNSVLEQECIKSFIDFETNECDKKRHRLSIDDLEKELQDAINEENYELAACLRDEITKRKS
jgi:hypothetical protein